VRQFVGDVAQKRLLIWLPPPKSVEMNSLGIQIHLAAHQPMSPLSVHFKPTSEQISLSTLIGASQKDQTPARSSLQIKPKPFGKASPRRSRLQPCSDAFAIRADIFGRLTSEGGQRLVLESGPNFCLPSPIETLDRGLKASLAWRGEHRHYVQTQAEPHDRTNYVSMLMRALENGVVIELRIVWQPHLLPMTYQRFPGQPRVHTFTRPSINQTAMQRNCSQDLYPDTTTNDQPLDDIELVKLCGLTGHSRDVPAWRRRRPSATPSRVEYAMPVQYPINCARRRCSGFKLAQQLPVNCLRTIFAQRTFVAEFLSQNEDSIFHSTIGAVMNCLWNGRTIAQIDAIQPLTFGALDPALHRAQTNSKLASNRTQRTTTTYRSHQLVTLRLLALFLFIVTSWSSVSDYDTDAKALALN